MFVMFVLRALSSFLYTIVPVFTFRIEIQNCISFPIMLCTQEKGKSSMMYLSVFNLKIIKQIKRV